MKIAVYADNTSQLDNARAYFEKWKRRGVLINEDYFLSPADLLSAVEEKIIMPSLSTQMRTGRQRSANLSS